MTDANLLLGYYDAGSFAGGLQLDIGAANRAVDALAEKLGLTRLEAAWGVHQVATLDMEHAIRLVSINRGFDPRQHALVCTGGAGPAHGSRLARALGCRRAIVPLAASGGSARGLLEASASSEVTRTALVPLDRPDAAEHCERVIAGLVEEAGRVSFGAGSDSTLRLALGMRYAGQGYELLVPVDPGERDPAVIAEAFHRRYEHAYGYRAEQPVEAVTWHAALVRDAAERRNDRGRRRERIAARPGWRNAYFPETGVVEVAVHERELLDEGDVLEGPCLVSETTTTTVVLPGDRVEAVRDGSLVIHVGVA